MNFEFKKLDFSKSLVSTQVTGINSIDQQVAIKKATDERLFDSESLKIEKFKVTNLQRLKALSEIATLPMPNEHHRYVTHNAFNSFSWLEFLCSHFDTFEELYLISYNFSEKPIDAIFQRYDQGQFKKLSIVISESIRFRMPKRYEQLEKLIKERNTSNCRLAGVWNHAKIILAKPVNSNNFFVVEGSGNFSENAYIEQYSFDNSEQIYNFHKNWIDNYVFSNIKLKRHFVL
jgi:hypothetical protein